MRRPKELRRVKTLKKIGDDSSHNRRQKNKERGCERSKNEKRGDERSQQ